MSTEFEEFKEEVIAEIRANIHKYPSVCKMLLGKIDRLEAEVNALRSTPSPRTYEQGAKDLKRKVVGMIDAAVNNGALKDNYTFAAIRALPTQSEEEAQ